MQAKCFIDTDVIIDFLIDRQPYATASTQIFELADTNEITLCTSALSINNIHYILRKVLGESKTREVIDDLMGFIDVLKVEKRALRKALNSDFKDFEDAIQHEVALTDKQVKVIITRNTKDYRKAKISVLDPKAFLQLREQ